MFALVLHIQLLMLKQFIFGALSMNKKAAQHSRQMCAEAEPCFQICSFCRIICLSISATPVSESSEIVVIYLFFSLWHFLNSEGVPQALSTAAAVLPLILLASTQVSTAVTGQGCGVPGLGRCVSLVTHGHCAACAFTEDREVFCGITKVQPSQHESLVRKLCFAFLLLAKGQNKY